ncbi:MAG: nucleoside deaminase [Eubacteriales bacterium]|nr:nucleoside deaminase [Eubacteriales bacterium]
MQYEKFMLLALQEAAKAKTDVPVGAVIVKNGEIIATAYNERENLNNPLAHAEILAIHRAAKALNTRRLNECTLFVTLEPCAMCAGAILASNIKTLVFGAFDRQYGCCGSLYCIPQDPAFSSRTDIIGGVLEKECSEIINRFFAERR